MRRTRNLLSSSHLFNPFSTLHPAPATLGITRSDCQMGPPATVLVDFSPGHPDCWVLLNLWNAGNGSKKYQGETFELKKYGMDVKTFPSPKKSCLCPNLYMLIGCSLFSQSSHPWLCSVERQDKDFNHVTQQRSITGYKQNIKISMYILFIKITYELSHTSVNYNCIWYIYSGYANRDRLKVPLLKSTTAPQLSAKGADG